MTIQSKWATVWVSLVFAGFFAAATEAQIALEVDVETGLGRLVGIEEPTLPVALGQDRLAILSPRQLEAPLTAPMQVIVFDRLHGYPDFVAVPLSLTLADPNDLWRKPIAIGDDRIVFPAPGPDGEFATADDIFYDIAGLDQPNFSVQTQISIGASGPKRRQDLMEFADGVIGWVDAGPDRIIHTADDLLRVAYFDRSNSSMSVEDIPFGVGVVAVSQKVAEGHFLVQSFGPDRSPESKDDEVIDATFDPISGRIIVKRRSLEHAPYYPSQQRMWPMGDGHSYCYPAIGADRRPGTADDGLAISHRNLSSRTPASLNGLGLFDDRRGPINVVSEADGTLVMIGGGPDLARGTADDLIVFVTPQGENPPTVATMPLGASLHVDQDPESERIVRLGERTLLIPFEQEIVPGFIIGGIKILQGDANTGRTILTVDLNGAVMRSLALTDDSAMFFLDTGVAVHGTRLDTTSPRFQPVTNIQTFDPQSVVACSPLLMAGTAKGGITSQLIHDKVQLWRVRGAVSFGESTANAQGYDMELQSDGTTPAIGGPSFHLILDDAPPNSFGYMLISLSRGGFKPTVDAEILLDVETMLVPNYMQTNPSGRLFYPIYPFPNPALAGVAFSYQALIVNPDAPRLYELSNGLTLVF